MLSVFMTPWMKPICIQFRDKAACDVDDGVEQGQVGFSAPAIADSGGAMT